MTKGRTAKNQAIVRADDNITAQIVLPGLSPSLLANTSIAKGNAIFTGRKSETAGPMPFAHESLGYDSDIPRMMDITSSSA